MPSVDGCAIVAHYARVEYCKREGVPVKFEEQEKTCVSRGRKLTVIRPASLPNLLEAKWLIIERALRNHRGYVALVSPLMSQSTISTHVSLYRSAKSAERVIF